MARGSSGSWLKYGCLTALALGVVVLIVLGGAAGIAVRQNRSSTFERRALVHEIPEPSLTEGVPGGLRLRLEIHTAALSVTEHLGRFVIME